MGEYRYEPLGPGQIRLFNLHAGGQDQPLRGNIIHLTLTNPKYVPPPEGLSGWLEYEKPYEAISYHWGSAFSTPYQVALDDGSVMPVTAALHGALQRVNLPDEDRLLWVDAICINQVDNNSKEKEEQIQLMPDIYRIAKRVLVWLGPETDNSPLAVGLVETIAQYSEYLDLRRNTAAHGGFELAEKRGMSLPPPEDPGWEALRAFWRRPWFRRVWVIQEFVYATEIVILCGGQEIDWKKLYLCAKVYPENRRLLFRGLEGSAPAELRPCLPARDGAAALHTIADLRARAWGFMSPEYIIWSITRDRDVPATELQGSGMRSDVSPIRRDLEGLNEFEKAWGWKMLTNIAEGKVFLHDRPDIMTLALSTSNFLATKAVDRLYGLRALFDGGGDDDFAAVYPEGTSDDETLTIGLLTFTIALLKRGRGPEVLAFAGLRDATSRVPPGVPSWVPDWVSSLDDERVHVPFGMLSVGAKVGPGRPEGESGSPDDDLVVYKAALDSTFAWEINEGLDTLSVAGVRADVVQQLFPGRLVMNPTIYEKLLGRLVPQYLTGESHEEVIFRTLVANRTHEGLRLTPEHFLEYVEMRKGLDNLLVVWLCFIGMGLLVATAIVVPAMRRISVVWHCAALAGLVYGQFLPLTQGIMALMGILIARQVSIFITMVVVVLAAWQFFGSGHSFVVNRIHDMARGSIAGTLTDDDGPAQYARYRRAFHTAIYRFELGVTARGFVGLFPLSTKPGDVVAILGGCDAPFVLRPRYDNTYSVLGDAYIHGIMDGEALQAFGLQAELIPLR